MRQVLEVLREAHPCCRLDVWRDICVDIHRVNRMHDYSLTIKDDSILVLRRQVSRRQQSRTARSLLPECRDPDDDRPDTHCHQILLRHTLLLKRDGTPLLLTVLHVERHILHDEHDQVLHDSHITLHWHRSAKVLSNLCVHCIQLPRLHHRPSNTQLHDETIRQSACVASRAYAEEDCKEEAANTRNEERIDERIRSRKYLG